MQLKHISKESFLEKHSFTLIRKGRDSLGVYNVYINKYYKIKDYIHGYMFITVKDLIGEYRALRNLKELPSNFSNLWHWDTYIEENTHETS